MSTKETSMSHWKNAVHTPRFLPRAWDWLIRGGWETVLLIVLILGVPALFFLNLDINPRSWHDEGDALVLARTLVEDGYYGVKVSDGYQTFGMVQSIGPAVILPAALAFKLFGASLVNGRAVGSFLSLLTLAAFYMTGRKLIRRRGAFVVVVILLSMPELRFLYQARQFLGIVPAMGFFLGGFLCWYEAVRTRKTGLAILGGILLGCSILTKSQYLVLGLGAFGAIALLDLIYYRQRVFKETAIAIAVGLVFYGAWNMWQWAYYGAEVFARNGKLLAGLAQVTYGIRMVHFSSAFRVLLGTDTGHFFMFWGFLAIVYAGFNSLKKDLQSMGSALLLIFTALNLAFVVFWTFPWIGYYFAPLAGTVLLISKLYDDLFDAVLRSGAQLKAGISDFFVSRKPVQAGTMAVVGTLIAVVTFSLWTGINFKYRVEYDVMDRIGTSPEAWPRPFSASYETADYLNDLVPPGAIVETSERELAILTQINFHTPDVSNLLDIIPVVYHGIGVNDYKLGREYFDPARVEYLVIGYFARFHQAYDPDYVYSNFERIQVVGSDGWEYEIFKRITPIPE